MEARIGPGTAGRLIVLAAFVALSAAAYVLSEGTGSSSVVLGLALFAYLSLAAGVVAGRPDAEVLAWLLIGTAALLAEAGVGSLWLPMATAAAVVLCADLGHATALLYPMGTGDAVDEAQEASRRGLLAQRSKSLGAAAGGSLAFGLLGAELVPPLVSAADPGGVVAIFSVAAFFLLAAVIWPSLRKQG